MTTTTNAIESKRKEVEVNDTIVMIETVENGIIKLKPYDSGRIIHAKNQVQATVWFPHFGQYHGDPITAALKTDVSYSKNARVSGLALDVNSKSFAIKYHNNSFKGVTASELDLANVPFFTINEKLRRPASLNRYVGNELVHLYYVEDVITLLEDAFSDWVEQHLTFKRITKAEKENGDYPNEFDTRLTDKSQARYDEKKEELEMSLAKSIGVYHFFEGGLIYP